MDPFTLGLIQQSIAQQLQQGVPQQAPVAAPAPSGLAGLATKVPPSSIKMTGAGPDQYGKVDGERHPKLPDYIWSSKERRYVKVNPGSLR